MSIFCLSLGGMLLLVLCDWLLVQPGMVCGWWVSVVWLVGVCGCGWPLGLGLCLCG